MHRILIIDDEDDIREVAAMSLETVAGWEVMVASSGAQGLARAATVSARRDPAGRDDARNGRPHHVSANCRRIQRPRIFRFMLLTAKVQATDRAVLPTWE